MTEDSAKIDYVTLFVRTSKGELEDILLLERSNALAYLEEIEKILKCGNENVVLYIRNHPDVDTDNCDAVSYSYEYLTKTFVDMMEIDDLEEDTLEYFGFFGDDYL